MAASNTISRSARTSATVGSDRQLTGTANIQSGVVVLIRGKHLLEGCRRREGELMLMADTMSIFFVILGFMLAFPALWLLCRGLWPNAVAAATAECDKSLFTRFVAGLPVTLGALIVAGALRRMPGSFGTIAAGGVLSVYLMYAAAGVAGLATSIGLRLNSPVDSERPWRATLRGSIVLELTYLLPIIGWFLILPASVLIGTGATSLALFKLKSYSRQTPASHETPLASHAG
jgi:hypothetical protein